VKAIRIVVGIINQVIDLMNRAVADDAIHCLSLKGVVMLTEGKHLDVSLSRGVPQRDVERSET
jgi:hypothetical protein